MCKHLCAPSSRKENDRRASTQPLAGTRIMPHGVSWLFNADLYQRRRHLYKPGYISLFVFSDLPALLRFFLALYVSRFHSCPVNIVANPEIFRISSGFKAICSLDYRSFVNGKPGRLPFVLALSESNISEQD